MSRMAKCSFPCPHCGARVEAHVDDALNIKHAAPGCAAFKHAMLDADRAFAFFVDGAATKIARREQTGKVRPS
jgi:hypothetical protein